ncbi:MAG: hypothetical protein ACI30R_03740 [Sodaliphilus sp.]
MKFDLSVLYHQANTFSILPAEDNRNAIYIVTDNQRIGSEVYNEIIASYNLANKFSTEDFNETIDHLSAECKAQLKSCNFVLAVYNSAGCFIAQTGKTRAIQVRPQEQDIVFDSRNLVLDIYSSKMKTTQLADYKPGDILMLFGDSEFETTALKRILSNQEISVSDKLGKIQAIKEFDKTSFLLVNAVDVKNPFTFNVLKEIKLKYVGYVAIICLIGTLVAWALSSDMLKGSDNEASVTDEDTLVTTSSTNEADTIISVQKEETKSDTTTKEDKPEKKKSAKNDDEQEPAHKAEKESSDKKEKKTPDSEPAAQPTEPAPTPAPATSAEE